MQRCQRGEVVDLLDNFLGEQGGVGELLCTLHHAVADCLQLTACQDGLKLLGHDVECDSWLGTSVPMFSTRPEVSICSASGRGGVTHLVFER